MPAYDPIFSASRSKARSYQRKIAQRLRLKDVRHWLDRTTKYYIRETIDLRRNHSEVVRRELCSRCPTNFPEYCESLIDRNNMYYCQYLSREYDAHVRLYLPTNRPGKNASHRRAHKAKEIEDLVRKEPGILRTRIREMIRGKTEYVLDVLDNDLVFQGRVLEKKQKINGRSVRRYLIKSADNVPVLHDKISEGTK